MFTENTMLYLYVETPLHAGTGSGLSSIDLPIQRERTTQYPMIQGSGIKGKLRATAEDEHDREQDDAKKKILQDNIDILFGPANKPTANGNATPANPDNEFAGALVAGDARLLLFPIRSLNGVFAYTTSIDVLNRFKRDFERDKKKAFDGKALPKAPGVGMAYVTSGSVVKPEDANALVLEEFSYTTEEQTEVTNIAQWLAKNALPTSMNAYWSEKLQHSLVILSDDDFRDFVLYATEVITRVRIKRETKTVEGGALWTEEHLPTDTLLYVPIYATNARKKGQSKSAQEVLEIARKLDTAYLQLGGDETVGRGLVQTRWGS